MSKLPGSLPQFYVTAAQSCPYLPDRVERKLFTALRGPGTQALNDSLSQQGFRRSQNVLYRPSCTDCAACLSARIRVDGFTPSRSQRRVLNRNADLERKANAPWATEDQYDLFTRYLQSRHATGGMTDMDVFEFAAMIEETPVRTRVIEYAQTHPNGDEPDLMAACLTDVLEDGLSMVYSFFDPSANTRSLGRFLVLDHIRIAQEAGLPYVYLGYWVPGSPKMDYKSQYQPLELFHNGAWTPFEELAPKARGGDLDPASNVRDQLAAIELPDLSD